MQLFPKIVSKFMALPAGEWRALWVLSSTTMSLLVPSLAASEDPEIPIATGQTHTTTHPVGQITRYAFEAKPGGTYLIEATQDGLDLVVTVDGPDAESRAYNSPLLRDESEFVLLEDTESGTYHILLISNESTSATGAHSITVEQIDAATAEASGWRLMSEAAAANADGDLASKKVAFERYQGASEIWRTLGRSEELAYAIYSAAMIAYWDLWDWALAATLAEEASAIYRDLEAATYYANTLFATGYALVELASEQNSNDAQATFGRALDLYHKALEIHQQVGNTFDAANVINYMGVAAFNRGDLDQAEAHWTEAAPLFAEIKEWGEEFKVLQNLAVIDVDRGFSNDAIRSYQYIVDNYPESGDPDFLATVLDHLGSAHRGYGNVDEALQSYSAALDIQREVQDKRGIAFSLKGLGVTYFAFGELDLATQYFRQALPIAEEVGDGRSQASIFTNLGDIAFLQADYQEALTLYERAIERTTSSLDLGDRIYRLARAQAAMSDYAAARSAALEALKLAEAEGAAATQADSLRVLGRASIGSGDPGGAVSYFEQALRIYASLGNQGGEAEALHGLALAARAEGDLESAVRYGNESLVRLENLRNRVAAPELRAFHSASRRQYYEAQIDLLMEQAAATPDSELATAIVHAALTVNERSRARLTMDLLSEASINLEKGLDPDLVERQRELTEQLAAYAHQVRQISREESPANAADDAAGELLNRMAAIETELDLLETEFRRSSPVYAGFATPETLTATEIQALLDPGTVLLQYALGNDRSFVWVVAHDSIQAIELADRRTIEDAARQAFNDLKKLDFSGDARRDLQEALSTLSGYVLSPLAELLGDKRLLVVPDGALQYVPFSVLPLGDDNIMRPLAESNEIVGVPSASVISAQRARSFPATASKTLAVIADPVFSADDPRIADSKIETTIANQKQVAIVTRSSVNSQLSRLAFAGHEAQAISELVAEEDRTVFTGVDASLKNALDPGLRNYKILHIATHGLVDSRYPALSSLAFSQFDAKGQPQEGFLRLHDIYTLDLNADLVVLSGCETALGREIRGEGLVGLTQGFMYAGARSLVVSLWQVEDRATAEFMTRFYRYIFDDGLSPPNALRQAQLSISAERRWSDPYFWGAFSLLGDWSHQAVSYGRSSLSAQRSTFR